MGRHHHQRHWASLKVAAMLYAGVSAIALLPSAASADEALVIARQLDINSLDPARGFCDTCQIYFSNVYDTLIGLGKDNSTLTPRLATKWEANADQSQFTFHLDPAAKFSDGSPVEAKDVKWTFERLKNIKGGAAFMMDGVNSVEAKDAHTVVVTLAGPSSEFLNIVSAPYTGIINSDVAAANGATAAADAETTDKAEAWFLANSAGSGPYQLVAYKPDDELRFKANPEYKRAKLAISDIVIKHTKDAVTQAQMLESGDADIAMQIDPDTAKTLKTDNLNVETIPSYNFLYVAIAPGAKGAPKLTKEIRQAIGYALDYDGIIEFTVGGQGTKVPTPIPNGFPGTAGLPEPKQDLAKAKELLAEAGVPDGFEINSRVPEHELLRRRPLAAQPEDPAGSVQGRDQGQPDAAGILGLARACARRRHSADRLVLCSRLLRQRPVLQFFGMMEGTPWFNRAGGKNDPSILNPQTAELLKKALASGGDEKEKAYHELAMGMIDDRIIIPVVSPNLVLASSKKVTGVRYSACCNLLMDELGRQ